MVTIRRFYNKLSEKKNGLCIKNNYTHRVWKWLCVLQLCIHIHASPLSFTAGNTLRISHWTIVSFDKGLTINSSWIYINFTLILIVLILVKPYDYYPVQLVLFCIIVPCATTKWYKSVNVSFMDVLVSTYIYMSADVNRPQWMASLHIGIPNLVKIAKITGNSLKFMHTVLSVHVYRKGVACKLQYLRSFKAVCTKTMFCIRIFTVSLSLIDLRLTRNIFHQR